MHRLFRNLPVMGWLLCGLLAAGSLAGCQTPATLAAAPGAQALGELAAGDVLKITFPSAPELNQILKIRPDGKISLPIIGEVNAAGTRLNVLQAEIARAYRPQLTNSDVFISLQTSAMAVYVSGAVGHPGKVVLDRPMTALEAIMEAGGASALANLKKVVVVRNAGNEHLTQTLDLSPELRGKKGPAFSLRAYDIVYVPERFF